MSAARDPVAEPTLADLAVFRPVKAGNTFEETVERLAQAVKLGVVPKGGRLPAERELADRLNVSRVTLREAIKALQQAGFVESRAEVAPAAPSSPTTPTSAVPATLARSCARWVRDEVLDALDFRAVVEPGAAELARPA